VTPLELTRRHSPWLLELPRYVPGAAPAGDASGKLSSNESPLPPPPAVVRAVDTAARHLNRYPDPLAGALRHRLAALHGIDAEALLVGNGSDELIQLLAQAHLGPGARAAMAEPPYLMQEIACRACGAAVTKVALAGYRHDLQAMAEIDAEVVFIPNPHNPTGTAVSRGELAAFLDRSCAALVVVDEAYIEFADDAPAMSALSLLDDPRVAVLRTFSKLYGLAGARIGYVAADPALIERLRRIRAPFSVNALAQAAALACLEHPAAAAAARDATRSALARIGAAFARAGYETVPSQANFLLVRAPDEDALLARLADAGISARPGRVLGVPGHVRVSAGSDAALARLEEVLAS